MSIKVEIGKRIVDDLPTSGTIAFGSGTTVNAIIDVVGQQIERFANVRFVSGSSLTSQAMRNHNVPETVNVDHIDICIDGADQVLTSDPRYILKGRGGALFREKVLWTLADTIIVGITDNKLVDTLDMAVPVEVDPFARQLVMRELEVWFPLVEKRLRTQPDGFVFYTDNGNIIVDCGILPHSNPKVVHNQLKSITGVVETGLFTNFDLTPVRIYVGSKDGQIDTLSTEL